MWVEMFWKSRMSVCGCFFSWGLTAPFHQELLCRQTTSMCLQRGTAYGAERTQWRDHQWDELASEWPSQPLWQRQTPRYTTWFILCDPVAPFLEIFPKEIILTLKKVVVLQESLAKGWYARNVKRHLVLLLFQIHVLPCTRNPAESGGQMLNKK